MSSTLSFTSTYTLYFSSGSTRDLDAIERLRADLEKRGPFMHTKARAALTQRLDILSAAAKLLVEPVPPSFGG